MTLQHGERELSQFGDNDLAKIISGVKTAFQKRHPEMKDIALPGQVVSSKEAQAPKRDLRQETLDLLSGNSFREPTTEEREKLKLKGYDTFLQTEAKSLYTVVAENQDYFWSGELDYVNARLDLRDFVPPALTVALRSKDPFLSNSFSKSQAVQLQMHETESQALQVELPGVRNIMLPASTGSQLDLAYFKETGRVLFTNRFAGALDEISGVFAALGGRLGLSYRLRVGGWYRADGFDYVGALSAVVFLENR